MTESENSQPQDDSDEDIYKDIPEFNFEDELAKLEGSKETYKQEANDLSEKVKALNEENIELKKSNEVLKKNLSTLLKTAQAEVQRKDSMIEELRTKVESFTFRRNKTNTKDKYTSTEDLYINSESQFDIEKQKNATNKNQKSKTHESRTSSDSEKKSINEDEKKKKESSYKREENSDCDNERKPNCSENSKRNFRHSGSSQDTYDRYRDRKFSKYEDTSGYRRPYRENHRDHLKYDSFDKKRHSRSSDNRFLPRRRNSRDRKDDHRKDDTSERKRRKSDESSERSRRKTSKKNRSHSRGSKESSLEKRKSRSSIEKDSKIKNTKPEVLNNRKTDIDTGENTKPIRLEDEVSTGMKTKQLKEKRSIKQDKRGLNFSAKSPLDALYNDMVSSINSNRFSSPKSGTPLPESDFEDEFSTMLVPNENPIENHFKEDWSLSFKNERSNETKPMTLYSRRMMRKFSSEKKEEKIPVLDNKKVEKEPGELTDDENIIESSKEFQELAKVASIECEIIEKVKENEFKEPFKCDDLSKSEPVLKEIENTIKESNNFMEVENNKEIHEVIEFSPFKNNYKLIEISPIKPKNNEHVLDYYNQRQQNIEEKSSSEKNNVKISDEKNPEKDFDIIIPPLNESAKKESKKTNDDNINISKETNTGKRKRRSASNQEIEKNDKIRKRKSSESEIGKIDVKKRKIKENEPLKKSTSTNCKIEPDLKPDLKNKEDILSFEFFKPVTKTENTVEIVSTATDYKMSATMSVTGVVRLETPNKCVEKLKNLMINEHMILNVLESKNNSQFSPLLGSKCIEMTPRRLLKNDLMLTDSEDDSIFKQEKQLEDKQEEMELEEEEEEVEVEDDDFEQGESSECDSDSGASDFVDLL